MARHRNPTPSYLPHPNGNALAVWTDRTGVRHFRTLPGPHGSEESRAAFARVVLESAASPTGATPNDVTINELCAAHLDHAEQHYRRADGTHTHELVEYKILYRLLRELYGDAPAAEFGPLALKVVRAAMLARDWCRGLVNQRIGRVKRIWKWGASEELVPATTYTALATVTGLQAGRTAARESEPVGPVDDATVDVTLAQLNHHVAGLIELQRLTGMRPGEACLIRRKDIDTGGDVWLYRPAHHKLAYKNKSRVIAIGPRGQELLRGYFTPDLSAYLFSPRDATDEHHSVRTANRVTPRFPSHMIRNAAKRKAAPKRTPQEKYDVTSYGRAVARAVDRANREGAEDAKQNRTKHTPISH